jgi:hypothetical protein
VHAVKQTRAHRIFAAISLQASWVARSRFASPEAINLDIPFAQADVGIVVIVSAHRQYDRTVRAKNFPQRCAVVGMEKAIEMRVLSPRPFAHEVLDHLEYWARLELQNLYEAMVIPWCLLRIIVSRRRDSHDI